MSIDKLAYYRSHSPFTDPGEYAPLLDALPKDLPGIVRAIQGLIIPPYQYVLQLHNLQLKDIEDAAFGIRSMERFLAKLVSIRDAPLSEPRPPRRRLGVNCRNFATLLVAILRQKGIAARERVGFEGYLGGAIHYEHRITEYWDARQHQWRRVDAYVDPLLQTSRIMTLDPLNISSPDHFSVAGELWQGARLATLDPSQYGDSEVDVGLPPIRYALLHDFDALNKLEVRGDDAWGQLIEKPEAELTADDLRFLDMVARLTKDPDANFDSLLALHRDSDYGQEVRAAARQHMTL